MIKKVWKWFLSRAGGPIGFILSLVAFGVFVVGVGFLPDPIGFGEAITVLGI